MENVDTTKFTKLSIETTVESKYKNSIASGFRLVEPLPDNFVIDQQITMTMLPYGWTGSYNKETHSYTFFAQPKTTGKYQLDIYGYYK